MTIILKQVCNGCGAERNLSREGIMGPIDIPSAEQQNGWRAVGDGQHLCRACIKSALASSIAKKVSPRADQAHQA